jgi:ATP synthase protein I
MAGSDGPDETGKAGSGRALPHSASEADLDRRRRQLDKALAGQKREGRDEGKQTRSSDASGYAVALRLSSEFIAGIVVGAAIGWIIDRLFGTSPWGLIIFLLLGFCAGVLNILRSAGLVVERKLPPKRGGNEKGGE